MGKRNNIYLTREDQRKKRRKQKVIVFTVTCIALLLALVSLLVLLIQETKRQKEIEASIAYQQSYDKMMEELRIQESIEASRSIEASIIAESESIEASIAASIEEELAREDALDIVAIDAGHGGYDVGSNVGENYEKDINLDIALLLKHELEDRGFTVLMTREDDSHLYLEERSAMINESKADISVSIHQNIFDQTSVYGAETWYYNEDSIELASVIQSNVIAQTRTRDRGVNKNDFHMIREIGVPSCLVECGFISNQNELNKLRDTSYQKKIVIGIADGIERYFEKQKEQKSN